MSGGCTIKSCYATGAYSLCSLADCPMQIKERSDCMNQDLAKVCALILLREGGWCRIAVSYSGGNPNSPREGIVRTVDENKKTQHIHEVNPFARTKEGYEQGFAIENWLHKNRQELLVESKLQVDLKDEPIAEYDGYNKRVNRIEYCLQKLKEENEILLLLGKATLGGLFEYDDQMPMVGIHLGVQGNAIEIRNTKLQVAVDIRKQLMGMIKIICADGDLND